MSLGCDYSHPLWAIYAVKWPNQCGRWLFYGRIRVCLFISAWALRCLFYCWRQCEGLDVRDKQMVSSRAFFMPLLVVLYYPSCLGTQDTWKTLGDGNILFFIEYGYLLYLLWHYYYGGDNGYSIFYLEVFKQGHCKVYTFLYNRCDTCILTFL